MTRAAVLLACCLAAMARPAEAQATFKPDTEGFIRNWLVLAPIPMAGQSGADEIHAEFLSSESTIAPRPDATVMVGARSMAWTAHQTFAYYIDFRESFDKTGGEYVVGYAVAYINAPAAMEVTLALSTNDQGKAWLNGKQVFAFEETRVLDKDTDRIPVSLVQGQNVLVLKVLNEVNSWQACVRFLRGTTPVTDLEIALVPK
jgi:hypothetical protein